MGKFFKKSFFLIGAFAFGLPSIGFCLQTPDIDPLEPWLIYQISRAEQDMLANVNPPGTAPGSVAASPSLENPRYFFHWVRDASKTMSTIIDLYAREKDSERKAKLFKHITDFISFSRANQLTLNWSGGPGDTGNGEVKFFMDGRILQEGWPRPQNDGPALRALALIKFANLQLDQGHKYFVSQKLYDGNIPTETLTKADLEFTAHHWREKSVDIWEEVLGHHFYTMLVQRQALLRGAQLADRLGDPGAAGFYREQIPALEIELNKHWDEKKGYIVATLDGEGPNARQKQSNLDIAVILGVLHANGDDDFFSVTDDRVLATAIRLIKTFEPLYEINQIYKVDRSGRAMASALGRYSECCYDGYNIGSEGNPWILATNAMAELMFRVRKQLQAKGATLITEHNKEFFEYVLPDLKLEVGEFISNQHGHFARIQNGLEDTGNRFLRRLQFHANPDGTLSEQLNRRTGFHQGAPQLTWSCESVLTATAERPER